MRSLPQVSLAVLALSACGPQPLARITGAIEGAELGGVSLALRHADDGSVAGFARSDADGRYAFEGVATGLYTVTPYLEGTRFVPRSASLAAGDEASFSAHPVLEVSGAVLESEWEELEVLHAGKALTDAEVRVEGEAIPYDAAMSAYRGPLATSIGSGSPVRLEVRWKGAQVAGSGVMPERPVLLAPLGGATLGASEDLVLSWSSGVDPEHFSVFIAWDLDGYHYGNRYALDGSLRALTIQASELPSGATVTLSVCASNTGTIVGDDDSSMPTPGLSLRATSAERQLEH